MSDGVRWVTDGVKLFAKQPLGLAAMTVVFFFMHVPVVIPAIGPLLAAVLSPFATLGLMGAFREVAARRLPTPLVFTSLFQNAEVRGRLLRLGAINAALVAAISLVLLAVEAGQPLPTAGTTPPLATIDASDIAWQLLLLIPVAALMWFAPMLAGWHGAGPSKAMFGSAIACWRNKGAMLMYALATSAVLAAVIMVIGALIDATGASTEAASLLVAPVVLVMLAVVQAGIYVMYQTVIGSN